MSKFCKLLTGRIKSHNVIYIETVSESFLLLVIRSVTDVLPTQSRFFKICASVASTPPPNTHITMFKNHGVRNDDGVLLTRFVIFVKYVSNRPYNESIENGLIKVRKKLREIIHKFFRSYSELPYRLN